MDVNQMAMKRIDILKDAVVGVLSTTIQSQEARTSLEKSFQGYSLNDEGGSIDHILANLTKVATDIALNRIDNLLVQDNIKDTLNTIDEKFVAIATPESENMDAQTPIPSLPKVTWTDIATTRKKKELEKLSIVLREKERMAAQLQDKVNTQLQEVGSMQAKVSSFSNNAEEVFHLATDSK